MPDTPLPEPHSTPAAAPPSADPPAGADYHPSQDDAAGLAAFRAAKAAAPAPEEAPPAPAAAPAPASPPPAPGAPASPTAPPAPPTDGDLDPGDAKLARILNRISRLEDERNAAQRAVSERETELVRLRERAAAADAYDQDFARFREDPEALFRKVKWDRSTIENYIAHGPSKVDAATAAVARETEDLKARLAKFEAADAERTRQARTAEFKAALPGQLTGKAEQFPLTHAFYSTPGELGDALFSVMAEAYRSQNREMPAEEAAQLLESTLTTHLERLSRPRSPSAPGPGSAPAVPTPSAPKPANTPTLTNAPPASAQPPAPAPDDDEDLLSLAAANLRKSRRAAPAA